MDSVSREAIGLLETTGFTPAAVALDQMDKAARIRVLQLELNDRLGVVVKVAGSWPRSTQPSPQGVASPKNSAARPSRGSCPSLRPE